MALVTSTSTVLLVTPSLVAVIFINPNALPINWPGSTKYPMFLLLERQMLKSVSTFEE